MCLTQGYSITCNTGNCSGGLCSEVNLTAAENIFQTLYDTDGKVVALALVPGTAFYAFGYKDETAEFSEEGKVEDCVRIVEQKLEFYWPCRTHTQRNVIEELAGCCCGMVAIHCEPVGNGVSEETSWISGYKKNRHWKLTSDSSKTGKKIDEKNGTTLTLTCRTTEKARQTLVIP